MKSESKGLGFSSDELNVLNYPPIEEFENVSQASRSISTNTYTGTITIPDDEDDSKTKKL